ncbi:MFS transporter [Streptomyces cellulosae]|uniref:MFS transporter n=1 Tax=Streptomyces cellulosae TaxID=1968 RepID=A0ABW7XVG1_STRCE
MSAFALLKDRSVVTLFAARLVSLTGNGMAPIALAFAVLAMPGASASTLGLVLTGRFLSQVLFVLVGGAIADRFAKKQVMVCADVAAGVVQMVIALLVITSNATPLVLAALAALSGAAAALFEPASRSIVPQLVSEEQLLSANALVKLAMRGGSIIGAALAGVLVATIGTGPTLVVDAASFLVSAALLVFVRVQKAAPPATGPTLLRQLKEGWEEFTSRQWVWVMVAQLGFVNALLAGGFYVLGPVVADRSLDGASSWSVILTTQAVGYVLGNIVALRIRPRRPIRAAMLLTVGFPLPLILLAGTAPVFAIAAAAFASAICLDLYDVTIDTALQKNIPAESLSRVMSYESMGSFACVPLGLSMAGPIADAVGVTTALTWAAVLMVLAGPIVLLLPSVRAVQDVRPADRSAAEVASG